MAKINYTKMHESLWSEIGLIGEMLSMIAPVDRVGRRGLERRKARLEAELGALGPELEIKNENQ